MEREVSDRIKSVWRPYHLKGMRDGACKVWRVRWETCIDSAGSRH